MLCCLAQIVLSWPLWYSEARTLFPLVPVAGLAFRHSSGWVTTQAAVTLLLPARCVLFPRYRPRLWALPLWFLWMIAQDLNRLQPWMYFYLMVWAVLLLGRSSDESRMTNTALCWLVAGVYAWGGFNKLTPYFAADNFPWFCEAFSWTKPLGQYPVAGYAVALAELLFAPGLLWRRSRPVFRWIVPAFHLFILLALSPLGLNWNTVVIPWNIAMGGMVWILFRPTPAAPGQTVGRAQFFGVRSIGIGIILAFVWVLPALNIFHRWPEALSWKMYSNTQTEATFYAESGVPCPKLRPVWNRHAFDNNTKLLIDDWAFEELRVPAFNSRYVFQQIAQYLCTCSGRSDNAGLYLLTVQRWNTSDDHWEQIPCSPPLQNSPTQ